VLDPYICPIDGHALSSGHSYSKQTVIATHVHQGQPMVPYLPTRYVCSPQEHLTSRLEALSSSACQIQRSRNHKDVRPTGCASRMCV
jgi:hypothetical protein